MSAFALLFDPRAQGDASPAWADLLDAVASYKQLHRPEHFASGAGCAAAKFDSASTRHLGVTRDEATGSWLMAVGTVIDQDGSGGLYRLLRDYLARGVQTLARLDGHFGLIIYDQRDKSVTVVSDPFGLISIFYTQNGKRVLVSTSALAVARSIASAPDEFGARRFILYGGLTGETTLWRDVKRLPPATVLRLTRDRVEKQNYWSFRLDSDVAKRSLDDSVDGLIETLSRAMRQGLAREGTAWLSLTGGFDSRTLAAVMYHAGLPFKIYCHGPPDSKDVCLSARISREMGWEYEYFDLPEDWGRRRPRWLERTLGHTDGHQDLLKRARIIREQTLKAQQYPVSYWGYGGETYRGYGWKQEFFQLGRTTKVNYDRFLDYRILPSIAWPILKETPVWARRIREGLKAELQSVGEQNPDWPNTVKLDLIVQYMEPALAGATMSSVLGLQRAIAPFDFKAGIANVLSINHKWRAHSRLFRHMLERISPALAAIETSDGGTASPMQATTLHKFLPYWGGVGKKLVWGVTRRFLGRNLWRKVDAGTKGAAYPLSQWRRDTLAQLEEQGLLDPAHMRSASLYDKETLLVFLARATADDFGYEALLSRVITLEMALRSVGASL